jgi:hypothetical protein
MDDDEIAALRADLKPLIKLYNGINA